MSEPFDVERARQLREQTTGLFRKEVRKQTYVILPIGIAFVVASAYASGRWAQASNTDQRLMYGMLYLISIEGILLLFGMLGLGLRIAQIFKEVKQSRLDTLNATQTPLDRAVGGAESLNPWIASGFPWKRVFLAYTLLCLAVAVAVGHAINVPFQYADEESNSFDIAADGSAHRTWTVTYPSWSGPATDEYPIFMLYETPAENIRAWDDKGQPLEVIPVDGVQYKVKFSSPILTGQPVYCKVEADFKDVAKKEGDEWIIRCGHPYGMFRYQFHYYLPEGAEVTGHSSTGVKWKSTYQFNTRKMATFSGEPQWKGFQLELKYRLNK